MTLPLSTRRRRRFSRGLVLGISVAALIAPPAVATESAAGPPVPQPEVERIVAERALDDVEELLESPEVAPEPAPLPRRDLTLVLRDLRVGQSELAWSDRRRARELLARPTDGDTDYFGYRRAAQALNDCEVNPTPGSHLCVHWAPSDLRDRPDLTDGDSNGIPDYVDQTRDELNHIWGRIVTQGGYRAPLPDQDGPDQKLDVYLADVGGSGLYGYCDPESKGPGHTASGYCVLDNDYAASQYGSNQQPLDNLRVTAAHEFFHTVQFAYDYQEDWWLMEGSAAWVEDEVYDDVDDNRQFIRGGPMTDPDVPLDASGHGSARHYAAWTWWRFLGERYPDQAGSGMPVVIRSIWQRADARVLSNDQYSIPATVGAIAAAGGQFTTDVAAYGEAKRHPGEVFEEGAGYRTVPLLGSYLLAARGRTRWKTATLAHLTSRTYSFVPGRRTAGSAWRLRVPIDAPPTARGSHVQVSVVGKDGSRTIRRVALNGKGNGRVVTRFSSSSVERVELTITNAGRRYNCWRSTTLACSGVSRDNGQRTKYRGIVFRR